LQIIETHCHLDYLKKVPLDEVLTLSKEAGVEKIITISVEPDNFDAVMELSQQYPQVFFTQGIHPHDAIKATEESYQIISERTKEQKMVAVGEIGLDYYYNHSPRNTQIEVFKKQLQIAINHDKPVVIHSRDADEDMMSILKEFAPRMPKKGVIHSFTSGPELAQCALDNDFFIGFNGIITFKNAEEVRDIVKMCPMENILVETDAPFLSPVPHRGKENNPSRLPHIIEKIAEIKGLLTEDVAKVTYQNALSLFNLQS
jgi:TatD DNase family protein